MARPTKYKLEYCQKLIDHMSMGFSYDTFGPSIGVCVRVASLWEKKHPEFLLAKQEAMGQCLLFWERMGIHGAAGKLPGFNATAFIFNMKNRFNWSDRTDLRISADLEEHQKDFSLLRSVPRKELIALAKKAT